MSDYVAATVTIVTCPSNLRVELLDVLNEYPLGLHWGPPRELTLEVLAHLNEKPAWFTATAASLDFVNTLADAIPAIGQSEPPTSSVGGTLDGPIMFTAQQDPLYEFDGEMVYYCPDLGLYRCFATADGEEHWSAEQLDDTVAKVDPTLTQAHLRAALDQLTGKLWRDRFAQVVPA